METNWEDINKLMMKLILITLMIIKINKTFSKTMILNNSIIQMTNFNKMIMLANNKILMQILNLMMIQKVILINNMIINLEFNLNNNNNNHKLINNSKKKNNQKSLIDICKFII